MPFMTPLTRRMPLNRHHGFTLNELLIALIVLGVIAAFAIPKVLKAVNDNRQIAQLREAAFILENTYYANRQAEINFFDGVANADDDLYHYLIDSINIIDASPTTKGPAGYSGGCNNASVANGYFLLPSGMIISGLAGADTAASGSPRFQLVCIDVDGVGGTNLPGNDVFYGNFLYQSTGKVFFWSSSASSPPNSGVDELCADDEDASCTLTVSVDSTSEDVGHMLSRNE
ncbi:MAG: type II secretion system protein [Cyanobacteria bacterium HKST-UBA06]|nr:type II secretion system protein [Cyanobacteria bacterium HKST-UBA06]